MLQEVNSLKVCVMLGTEWNGPNIPILYLTCVLINGKEQLHLNHLYCISFKSIESAIKPDT